MLWDSNRIRPTDFLDEEMEIMQVRDELDQSYESAGWKVVYVLMEPSSSSEEIDNDLILLNEMRGLHNDLANNHDVVGGGGVDSILRMRDLTRYSMMRLTTTSCLENRLV